MKFLGHKWGEDAVVLVGAIFVVWLGLLLWGAGERFVRGWNEITPSSEPDHCP
jgi:hypothetical protein